MKTILSDIIALLNEDVDFAVATILDHSGSTPRTAGTKMVILPDGTIRGTIGGGLVEAQVMEMGKKIIPLGRNILMDFKLHQDLKESLDMICGGELRVFIETITRKKRSLYTRIAREVESRKKCMLVSELCDAGDNTFTVRQCLITDAFEVVGENLIPHSFSNDLLKTHFNKNAPVITDFGNRKITWEPIAAQGSVFLFGGGHVSQKVAQLTALLELPTVVIDDRAEFANKTNFNKAHEIHVIDDFNNAFDPINIDSSSAIIILTRGHLYDQTVLADALKTKAHYIGMIGSRKKRDLIYKNLMDQGTSAQCLKTVHCPIGMEIHAETPAEIAVSIISELIAMRNKK
jgi:xanthine dehydrogenase accessory factor